MTLEEIRKKNNRLHTLSKKISKLEDEIIDAKVDGYNRFTLNIYLHDIKTFGASDFFQDHVLTTYVPNNKKTYNIKDNSDRKELRELLSTGKMIFIDTKTLKFIMNLIDKADKKYVYTDIVYSESDLLGIAQQIYTEVDLNTNFNGYGITASSNSIKLLSVKPVSKHIKDYIKSKWNHVNIEFETTGRVELL